MKWTGEERRSKKNGRREADRSVCVYHDICHETLAGMKQNCIDHIKSNEVKFEKMEKSKLDGWIFKLFLATTIPIVLTLGGWIGWNAFETVKIVTKLDTNQRHLMEEFAIKPIEK